MKHLNKYGQSELRSLLHQHGHRHDNFNAWFTMVEDAINNRQLGESLSVELFGIKTRNGYNVDFTPSADMIDDIEPVAGLSK